MAEYELYRDRQKKYRWRLKANNGEVILVSKSYASKQNAVYSIGLVQKYAPIAPVVDISK